MEFKEWYESMKQECREHGYYDRPDIIMAKEMYDEGRTPGEAASDYLIIMAENN